MSAFTYTRIIVVVLAALTLAACPAKKQKQAALFVNAATGSDAGPGTQSSPLKTLTRAMRMAKSGMTVNVLPGVYDLQNGETFPISVPDGVTLLGDEANKGGGSTATRVVGGGLAAGLNGTVTATLSPGAGSTIAGFTITNNDGSPTGRSGLALTSNSVTLRNNTVTGATHSVGVYVGASTNHMIRGNRIVDNQGSGLGFIGGGAGSKVENNLIKGNGYGVKYQVAGGDLGSAGGSAGGNEIACNTQNDLEVVVSTPITISAAGNYWDHSSPTLGCSTGSDICDPNNTATIVATPATQAASNCGSVTLYVDVTTGQDTNPGTQAQPFQSITHALSVATSGATVQVAPGTYDALETFPIAVPAGVLLIGDEPNKGTSTSIAGGGPAAGFPPGTGVSVMPGAGSTIAGFTITNGNGAFGVRRGVILANNTVTLRNNTIAGATHQYGVYVGASTNHVIAGNRIVDNGGAGSGVGLGFIDGGTGSKVENNVITGNGFGVEYDVAGGDLGGGSAGSAGGNVISCNAAIDLVALAAAPITINAANNLWDHTTPTFSCNFSGDDICDLNANATFIATPSAQTTNPSACP